MGCGVEGPPGYRKPPLRLHRPGQPWALSVPITLDPPPGLVKVSSLSRQCVPGAAAQGLRCPFVPPHAVDLDTLRTQWELWPGDSDLKAASGNSRRPWGLHAPPCPVSFKHLFSPLSFSILLDEEGHIKITGL